MANFVTRRLMAPVTGVVMVNTLSAGLASTSPDATCTVFVNIPLTGAVAVNTSVVDAPAGKPLKLNTAWVKVLLLSTKPPPLTTPPKIALPY